MKNLLPYSANGFKVLNKYGDLVVETLSKKQAEFLATVTNAHYPMLDALEKIKRQSSKRVAAGRKNEVDYFNIAVAAIAQAKVEEADNHG